MSLDARIHRITVLLSSDPSDSIQSLAAQQFEDLLLCTPSLVPQAVSSVIDLLNYPKFRVRVSAGVCLDRILPFARQLFPLNVDSEYPSFSSLFSLNTSTLVSLPHLGSAKIDDVSTSSVPGKKRKAPPITPKRRSPSFLLISLLLTHPSLFLFHVSRLF
ncbi:hypothetical protein GEMRC1_002617 [Eukaryota sp. GEM-RC1]